MTDSDEAHCLDYFSGGVPTGGYFCFKLEDLRALTQSASDKESGIVSMHELCYIGLFAYFEAFCKDHFASLINIEPTLVGNLRQRGQNVEIDGARAVLYSQQLAMRVGFLLAEKYDFGSAQKINALFSALLNITPFGKSEVEIYSKLLNDRNLLVHHGGVYTLSYLEQTKLVQADVLKNAFYNSCIKKRTDVLNAIQFVADVAQKLLTASLKALLAYLTANGIEYLGERKKALDYVGQWG